MAPKRNRTRGPSSSENYQIAFQRRKKVDKYWKILRQVSLLLPTEHDLRSEVMAAFGITTGKKELYKCVARDENFFNLIVEAMQTRVATYHPKGPCGDRMSDVVEMAVREMNHTEAVESVAREEAELEQSYENALTEAHKKK